MHKFREPILVENIIIIIIIIIILVFRCSCSVITICATCNIISPVKYDLYLYIWTFHNTCAVPNTAVFCSSLISCFPIMLLRYCLSDSEVVPVAPVITGITLTFTFHVSRISINERFVF
jgi:hypothetical protein